MRIYVCGASAEAADVAADAEKLDESGWTITFRWWKPFLEGKHVPGKDASVSREERVRYALKELAAIREADVVWLRSPEMPTTGAWVELGMAIASAKHLVVSGEHRRRTIFTELAHVILPTHEHALEYLTSMV
jgi:hypothetical protein